MQSIDFPTLLTIIYVLVDDWYKQHAPRLLKGKAGVKPVFSDSEVITLMLAQDFLCFESETQFLAFMRANYRELFPKLCDQSQFNRRARRLAGLMEALRRHWLYQLDGVFEDTLLLDTKPVPVVGYKRGKGHSDFAGSADYGYCASRKLHYYGYKLVMVTTLSGLPLVYDLVPANTDERAAAETVLADIQGCTFLTDKGFIGEDWQADVARATGNRIFTPMRDNQSPQNPLAFDRLLGHFRERIEGVFNQIQNTGRQLERLLRKTIAGIGVHVAAKVASHTLRVLLKKRFGIAVLTFEQHPVRNSFTLT